MKSIFTFILFLSAGLTYAQNFVYSTEMNVVDKYASQNFIAAEIYFSTPEPEDITFQFKVLQSTMPSNWNFSLCGYGTCYVGVPNAGEFQTITKKEMEEGKEAFFKLNVNPKSFDSGYVQIYVYQKGNMSRGDTVSMKIYNLEVLSTDKIAAQDLKVYPNPAVDQLNISLKANGASFSAQLTDAFGKTVGSYDQLSTNTDHRLDISTLEAGVYYLRLTTDSGIVETRKIFIQ